MYTIHYTVSISQQFLGSARLFTHFEEFCAHLMDLNKWPKYVWMKFQKKIIFRNTKTLSITQLIIKYEPPTPSSRQFGCFIICTTLLGSFWCLYRSVATQRTLLGTIWRNHYYCFSNKEIYKSYGISDANIFFTARNYYIIIYALRDNVVVRRPYHPYYGHHVDDVYELMQILNRS